MCAAAFHYRIVRERPSGTVTFLFSDVVGSTRLLREHGERYAELLSEQRAVHSRASDAIASAAEAQAELRESPISVRIGLTPGSLW